MDTRDKHLVVHHRRRLALAAGLPVDRQHDWAEREVRIAKAQHRLLMLAMALQWLHDLEGKQCHTTHNSL